MAIKINLNAINPLIALFLLLCVVPLSNVNAITEQKILQVTPVTTGIYVLIRPNTKIPETVLSSKSIAGVVLRGDWQTIAPAPGEYELSYFHQEIARASAAGKAVSLVINNGGLNTPDYINLQVKQKLRFVDQNQFHKTAGKSVEIPVFWDQYLVSKKKQLLTDLAKEFGAYTALQLVSVQCANATTDDWNLPNNADWQAISFSEEKLLNTCTDLIDHAAKVFPTQSLRMAIGRVPRKLVKHNPDYITQSVWRHANATIPGRFYLQRHNLFVNTPTPSGGKHLAGWQPVYAAMPSHAAQFLGPLVDTKSCRMNGKKKPCDVRTMLKQIIDISQDYKFHYVEIYGADFKYLGKEVEFKQWANSFAKTKQPAQQHKYRVQAKQAKPKTRVNSANHEDSYGSWSNPPTVGSKNNNLTRHHTFYSKLLEKEVGYSLYLPKQIDASKKIPIIYWLHGKKGDESRGAFLAHYLDKAIKEDKIRPTAMVFVNGGKHSFYSDSYDGNHPVESMIMQELIPHIERNHPVADQASQRLLEGFSMGGFGALKLAAKYPDYFNSVAIYGAALLDQDFLPKKADLGAYQNVFNSNKEYFIENTPRYWLEKNKQLVLKNDLAIRMRVGSADGTQRYNNHLHTVLKELEIPHEYDIEDGIRHATRQYYEADNGGSFAFHEQAMKKSAD